MLALAAAATFAVSMALSKHFLREDTFWHFYGSSRVGFALGLLCVAALAEVRRGAPGMVRHRGFIGLVTLVEVIVSAATITSFAAIVLGPVSLVVAISAIQPALVFLYSLVLATLLPAIFGDWIIRGSLPPQAAGIAAITVGVVLISLSPNPPKDGV